MKKTHAFGVECKQCGTGVLVEIPKTWADLPHSTLLNFLAQGVGLESSTDSKQAAVEMADFYQEHLSHGAEPCVSELEEPPYG